MDGNVDKAIDFLRKKGLVAAGKKSGRTAAQGLIVANVGGNDGSVGVLIEVGLKRARKLRNCSSLLFAAAIICIYARS